jgi:hypothetical protein
VKRFLIGQIEPAVIDSGSANRRARYDLRAIRQEANALTRSNLAADTLPQE